MMKDGTFRKERQSWKRSNWPSEQRILQRGSCKITLLPSNVAGLIVKTGLQSRLFKSSKNRRERSSFLEKRCSSNTFNPKQYERGHPNPRKFQNILEPLRNRHNVAFFIKMRTFNTNYTKENLRIYPCADSYENKYCIFSKKVQTR